MTVKQIFHTYFKRKSTVFLAFFLIALIGRSIKSHKIEWNLALWMFLFLLLVVVVLGFMDYCFYEFRAKKMTLKLLNQSPLKEFSDKGFIQEEDSKLNGNLNGFLVTLSPLVNSSGQTFLVVLIPLKVREGLDQFFIKFDDLFNFSVTEDLLFAKAVIKNYNKLYDFDALDKAISDTTRRLTELNIQSLEIVEDAD